MCGCWELEYSLDKAGGGGGIMDEMGYLTHWILGGWEVGYEYKSLNGGGGGGKH